MNILIVDDIPLNRKLLRITLEAEGHAIVEAADGVEALAVLLREKVDLLISDVLMPNMDGFRLCHEIRKSENLRALPFIVYTSTYTSPNDMQLAQTIGADKYLTKPASREVLLAAIQSVIGSSVNRAVPVGPGETYVLQQYSQALVNKLEEKNSELQQSISALQRAHDRIVELNASLERRVEERTAELTRALLEVKELTGLLPICSYCKKIRDEKSHWQPFDRYISDRSKARFSHSFCPECYNKHLIPQLAEMGIEPHDGAEPGKDSP
jgi:CheY-like chemotaxis protein